MDCTARTHELLGTSQTAEYMWLTQAGFWLPLCGDHCAGWRRSAIPATMPVRIRSATEEDELIAALLVHDRRQAIWADENHEALAVQVKSAKFLTSGDADPAASNRSR